MADFYSIKVKYVGKVKGNDTTERFMVRDAHGHPVSFDPGQEKTFLVDASLEKTIEADAKNFQIVDKKPPVGPTQGGIVVGRH